MLIASLFLHNMPIRFRCIRCQHAVQATEKDVGRKMYCPVCYFQLTVPAESTVKQINLTQLYEADEKPIDVREMQDRRKLVSLRCKVCHTNIAVTKEQVGQEIECPECGTKTIVPKEIEEKVDAAMEDKLDRIMRGLGELSDKEVYGVRDGQNLPAEDWSQRFPVYCKLCGTMMYALESQVGQELTCPDCETKTVVPPRPKKMAVEPNNPLQFEGSSTFGVSGDSGSAPASLPSVLEGDGMLVPVVCRLCRTRMYARESEIGGFKTCPDCETKTEIKAVPKEMMSTYEEVSGDYEVDNEQHPGERPVFRTLADYRTVEGSLDKEIWDKKKKTGSEPDNHSAGDIFGVAAAVDRPVVNLLAGEVVEPMDQDEEESEESRKRKQKTIHEKVEEAEQKFQSTAIRRRELPKNPFLTGLFFSFCDLWVILRLLIATLFFCLTLFVGQFLYAPAIVLSFLGFCVLANTAYSLFIWSASGNDFPQQEDWFDLGVAGTTGLTLWLFFVAVLAATPGLFLNAVFSPPSDPTVSRNLTENAVEMEKASESSSSSGEIQDRQSTAKKEKGSSERMIVESLVFAVSCWLFFPVLFLSSMENDSSYALLGRGTLRSLLYETGPWLIFYAITFLLALFWGLAPFWFNCFVDSQNAFAMIFGVVLNFSVFVFCPLLYFRLLGRLAWVLEDRARETEEDQED